MPLFHAYDADIPNHPVSIHVREADLTGFIDAPDALDQAASLARGRFNAANAGDKAKAEKMAAEANEEIAREHPELEQATALSLETHGLKYDYARKPDRSIAMSLSEALDWLFTTLLAYCGGFLGAAIFATYVQASGFSLATSEHFWRALIYATPMLFASLAMAQWVERIGDQEKARRGLNLLFVTGLVLQVVFLLMAGLLFGPREGSGGFAPVSFDASTDPALLAEIGRWFAAILPEDATGWIAFVTHLAGDCCLVASLKAHGSRKAKTGRLQKVDVRIDHVAARRLLDVATERQKALLQRILQAETYLSAHEAGLEQAGREAEARMLRIAKRLEVARARATAEIIELEERRPHLHAAE